MIVFTNTVLNGMKPLARLVRRSTVCQMAAGPETQAQYCIGRLDESHECALVCLGIRSLVER